MLTSDLRDDMDVGSVRRCLWGPIWLLVDFHVRGSKSFYLEHLVRTFTWVVCGLFILRSSTAPYESSTIMRLGFCWGGPSFVVHRECSPRRVLIVFTLLFESGAHRWCDSAMVWASSNIILRVFADVQTVINCQSQVRSSTFYLHVLRFFHIQHSHFCGLNLLVYLKMYVHYTKT